MNRFRLALFVWLLVALVSPGHSEQVDSPPSSPVLNTGNLQARLISVADQIAPGATFTLLLEHEIRPGWHTYWINPGDSGAATTLDWREPQGFEFGKIEWPYPERIAYGPLMNYGYHGTVLYPIEVTAPENLQGSEAVFNVKGEWLVCADVCIPERGELRLTVPVGDTLVLNSEAEQLALQARQKVPQFIGVDAQVRAGDVIELQVAMPNLNPDRIQSVDYFPYAEALIDNPAEQKLKITKEGITLKLTPGWDYDASANFNGILVVVEEAGETRTTAFEIRPTNAGAPPQATGEAGLSLATALFFAFLGGLILNLMPCVFPVLSIKILSLMSETTHLRSHGWMYVLGVVLSFVAIAGLLIALRAGGAEIGWGFQLQSPWVVGLLVYLFLLVGLNLSGYFEIGTSLMSLGAGPQQQSGYSGSFFTGVLATLVAAPCTAPFMASAIGFALTQSNLAALLIFTALGFGMAVPYLALCYSPGLIKRLPKPGPWMARFKELLAFPLYASAIWLLWVLSIQTGATGVLVIGAGAVLLVFAIWLLKHLPPNGGLRHFVQVFAFILLASVVYSPGQLSVAQNTAPQSTDGSTETSAQRNYEAYSAARLAEYRQLGPVFVNFTAAWCVTCKVNEAVALSTDATTAMLAEKQVRYLKGDWTNEDPEITRKLAEHGRSGVPLYLLYHPDQSEPVILPQILTENLVLQALQKL
ncbi:MAG: protein-disulfide reductase DsbD family protein [Pseudomonadales bacterium]